MQRYTWSLLLRRCAESASGPLTTLPPAQFHRELRKNRVSPWTLVFSSKFLEALYAQSHFNKYHRRASRVLGFAAVGYFLFSFTDILLWEEQYGTFMPLRGLVCLMALLASLASNLKHSKYRDWVCCVSTADGAVRAFSVMLSLCVVTAFTVNCIIDYLQNESFATGQTTGLLLILAGATVLLKMQFRYLLVAILPFMLAWGVIALVFGLIEVDTDDRGALAYTVFIVQTANLLFMFGGYESERLERLAWLKETMLKSRHIALKQEFERITTPQFDLDSPAEKILSILQGLMGDESDLNETERAQVRFVVDTLRTNPDVYNPDVAAQLRDGRGALDKETRSYLLGIGNVGTRRNSLGGGNKQPQSASGKHGHGSSHHVRGASEKLQDLMKPADRNRFMKQLANWNFEIFELERLAKKRTLSFMADACLNKCRLVSKFRLPIDALHRFLELVEGAYHERNPYHRQLHGADVVHASTFFLTTGEVDKLLTDIDMLSLLIAAAVHDVDHPGTTNAFHVAVNSDLAVLYNDRSVLENHHASFTFRLLKDNEDADFLRTLSDDDKQLVRKNIINLVLATDLASHFELVAKIRSTLLNGPYDKTNEEQRNLLTRAVLKCADISNPSKADKLMSAWTELYLEESYQQGDRERDLGLTISPYMDRTQPQVPKLEVGFIEYLVQPLYLAVVEFTNEHAGPAVQEICVDALAANLSYWKGALTAEIQGQPYAQPQPPQPALSDLHDGRTVGRRASKRRDSSDEDSSNYGSASSNSSAYGSDSLSLDDFSGNLSDLSGMSDFDSDRSSTY